MNTKIIAILCGALALRLAFVFYLGHRIVQPDEGVAVSEARNLFDYGVLGHGDTPSADHPPALSSVLAVVFHLAGPSVLAGRIFYAFVGTLAVWLLYSYATEFFGKAPGLFAACMAAVYPFFIYWSGVLMTENLALACALAALWQTQGLLSAKRPSLLKAAFAGLLWGAASVTRTQNMAFLLLLPLWLLWRRGVKDSLRWSAVFLAAGLALPGLWAARNWKHFGTLTLDTHGGYTLIISTMFYDQWRIDQSVADTALRQTEIYGKASMLPPAEQDRAFYRETFRYILANPKTYILHNCVGNFQQLWRFYPRMNKTVGDRSPFLNHDPGRFALVSLLTEPVLIVLAIIGLYFGVKEGLPIGLPCLFIAITTLIHTLMIAQMRYRMPMMPEVVLLASLVAVRVRLPKMLS